MGSPLQHLPLVTVAALYGAAGSVVGPRVAERLEVEFLGRDVAQTVAAETGLPTETIEQIGEEPRTRLSRLTASVGRLSTVTGGGGGSMERLDLQQSDLRGRIEELIARTRHNGGVVLGHCGMVVLRSVPWALHVYLRGPREARAWQASEVYGINEETAARRLKRTDAARFDFARRVYGVDVDDPSLYHLVLDSTALNFDACVDLIVEAARARARDPGSTRRAEHRAGR
jgi:cytidylate kinase